MRIKQKILVDSGIMQMPINRRNLTKYSGIYVLKKYLPNNILRMEEYTDNQLIDVQKYGLVAGDVDKEQAIINAKAIEKAIEYAKESKSHKNIIIPEGIISIHLNQSEFDASKKIHRIGAVRCSASDVTISGHGKHRTILRAYSNGQDGYSYSVIQFGLPPLDNGNIDNYNIILENMTIDGNYYYTINENWSDTAPISHAAIHAEGLQDCVFRNLCIINCGSYGIGLQNGGYINNEFENIHIENTMADGIDVKDNGSITKNNILSAIVIKRFGVGVNHKFPFAGVDLMGESWIIRNLEISHWGKQGTPSAGLRFKQGSVGGARGVGAVDSSAKNVRIYGDQYSKKLNKFNICGIHVKCENVLLENITILDVDSGIVVSQPNLKIYNFSIKARHIGIFAGTRESRSQHFDGADNLLAQSGSVAVYEKDACGINLRSPGSKIIAVDFDVPSGNNILNYQK